MITRVCKALLAVVFILAAGAAAEEVMTNDYVRVAVDPAAGGAVTSMTYRKAMTFELIRERGAGVAAEGGLWEPRVRIGNAWADFSATEAACEVEREGEANGEQVITLKGQLSSDGGKLSWTRTFRMAPDESGFRMTDTLSNDGPAGLSVALASISRIPAAPWRKNLRSWCGDERRSFYTSRLQDPNQERKFVSSGSQKKLFWRVAGQYGTGFLCTTTLPAGRAQARQLLLGDEGLPLEMDWESSTMPLIPGGALTITREVLIDECGRAGNDPSALVDADRLITTVDLREAGMPGEVIPGAVTLVAARPTNVKVVLREYRGAHDNRVDEKTVAEFTDTLSPGRWLYHHVDVRPRVKGWLWLEAEVSDEDGKVLARSRARSLIDGEGMDGEAAEVWKLYQQRIPHKVEHWDRSEVSIRSKTFRGPWKAIGSMMAAEEGVFRPLAAVTDHARRQLAYLKANYPTEAEMIAGAAEALGVEPERLAYGPRPATEEVACMDVFFNGPDGPINAFSKERYGHEYQGLEHVKVIPATGYRFHKYLWRYGVNSEGLSFSGASGNPDPQTKKLAEARAAEWKKAGKPFSPSLTTMMATCRTVDEAIAFITNPEAPYNGEANYLLVDREGNAARIESVGILHRVFRYDPNTPGFLAAGNYQHMPEGGGLSVGALWDWAANTMMRERFIREVAGARRDNISLNDAIWIMETHGPGGMCQHGDDNPSYLMTVTSFIAVCRTGELYLTQGWPCRTQYVRFTLDDE